jgi:type IV secretory pathway VirB2 component (pilin)
MRNFLFLAFINFVTVSTAFGASLKGTADGLGKEAIKLGLALGVFALVIAGIYLAMGKQEGGQKVSYAVMGILVVLTAPSIVTTLRSIAGGA